MNLGMFIFLNFINCKTISFVKITNFPSFYRVGESAMFSLLVDTMIVKKLPNGKFFQLTGMPVFKLKKEEPRL